MVDSGGIHSPPIRVVVYSSFSGPALYSFPSFSLQLLLCCSEDVCERVGGVRGEETRTRFMIYDLLYDGVFCGCQMETFDKKMQ